MPLHRFSILDEEEHNLHGEESVLVASRKLFREESVDQRTRVIDNRVMMVQEELDKLEKRDTKMRAPRKKLVHGQHCCL